MMKNSLHQTLKIIFSMREKKAGEESLLQQCIDATAPWPLAFAQHRCITALLFPVHKWREEEMNIGAPPPLRKTDVRRGEETKNRRVFLPDVLPIR